MFDSAATPNLLNLAIPDNREVRLSDLRRLHAHDPEAVYELAISDSPANASSSVRGLQHLARTLSLLMREGFVIASAANQTYATTPGREGVLALDDGRDDELFLRGLYAGGSSSDKMRPQHCSDAHIAFYLQEHPWDELVRATKVLRVEHDDAQAVLSGSPRYQFGALLDCAREVVRTPNVVYRGLRTDGALKGGWAFCGMPSRRWTNSGYEAARPNFVFLVFATEDGCVFDWDWAPECPMHPGRPRNAEERFPAGETESPVQGELLLGNVRGQQPAPFRPEHAWYSTKGDCVFWYLSDRVSYADRYDEYLTAFFDADKDANPDTKCVGFKLKSVSRLIRTIKQWAAPGSSEEGINVHFNRSEQTVTLSYLMRAWQAAALPQSQDLFPAMRLMKELGERGVAAIQHAQPISLPAQLPPSEALRT